MKKYIIMFIMLLLPLNIYAATGSIKASSSSSNVTINNTFTVTVKVSSNILSSEFLMINQNYL